QNTVDSQQQELRRQQELIEKMQGQPPARPAAGPDPAPDDKAVRDVIEGVLKEREEKTARADAEVKLAKEAEGVEGGTDRRLNVEWRDGGLTAENRNKDFRFHVGGIAQFDFGWFSPDQHLQAAFPGQWNDGADIRRLRLRLDGTWWEVIDFVTETEFAS